MRTRAFIWVVALLLGASLGCGKSGDKSGDKSSAKSSAKNETTKGQGAFHEPVLAAFKQAGFAVEPFEQSAARPYRAKACVQGEVDQLDVLLCQYPNAEAAKAASSELQRFLAGAMSGVVRQNANLLLGVADRKKVDLQGKRINGISKRFVTPTT